MPDLVPSDPAPLGRPKRIRPDRTHVTRGIIRAVLFVVLVVGGTFGAYSVIYITFHDMSAPMAVGALYGGAFVFTLWAISDWTQRQKRRPPE